jgi:hypothetical protein
MFELELRSESLYRSLLEGMDGKGWKGTEGASSFTSFFILPFSSGPKDGLCHHGQQQNMVEVTLTPLLPVTICFGHKMYLYILFLK